MARSTIDEDDELPKEDEFSPPPPYDLDPAMAIPVSRKAGQRWKEKIDGAKAAVEIEHAIWNQTFDLYRRTCEVDLTNIDSSQILEYKGFTTHDTDENFLREAIKYLLRATYSRNPAIEVDSELRDRKNLADVFKKTIKALFQRKASPGINARGHFRRWIMHGHLTNFGVIRLNYQPRKGSQQEAADRIREIQTDLVDANKIKDIDALYAELEILEEEIPVLPSNGISLVNILPHRLLVDPEASCFDLSDAKWVAEEIDLDREYLRQKYYMPDPEDEANWVRRSDGRRGGIGPTASVDDGRKIADKVVDKVMEDTSDERARIIAEHKIRCYFIWDKLTRQMYLYSDESWEYPLWVWDDPLGISRFFPYFILSFAEPIDGIVQAGEPGQYIGTQREINRINRRISYTRKLADGALIYNSSVLKGETAERLIEHMQNPNEVKAFGIEWDPDKAIEELLTAFVPQAFQRQELYDTTQLRRTIDRQMNINPALRGEQYKTNTTNKAIETYQQGAEGFTGEQLDIIEDVIEEVGWACIELIGSRFTKDEIVQLIGRDAAEAFTPMSVQELNTMFGLTVVAGSTEKPSSQSKKEEALKIAQALGQVGQAAPMATMRIIMRMFQEAFSEFLVTEEDYATLIQEIQNNMTKGQSAPGAEAAAPPGASPQKGPEVA